MLSPDVLYTSKKSPAAMEKLTSSARSDGLMSGNVTCIVWSLLLMLLLHWCTHGYRRKSSTSLHLPRLCYKGKGQILTIYMLQNKVSIYISKGLGYIPKNTTCKREMTFSFSQDEAFILSFKDGCFSHPTKLRSSEDEKFVSDNHNINNDKSIFV